MNPINIVCATDDKYVPYCGVMLTSLFENNKEREVNVYVFVGSPLSENNQRVLKQLAEQYYQTLHFCVVKSDFINQFAVQGEDKKYLSIVTYYRLFAVDLLPKEVSQVLYMDCDIIVDGAIGELFDLDWDGIAVGVIPDMCTEWDEYYERLGYDKSKGYFNAGVTFMNLDYWRKNNVAQECFDYMQSHYDKLTNNDQDVLNAVLCERKKVLPLKYNYQIQLLMPYFFKTFTQKMQREIMDTKEPTIIHYAAELKPWMAKYYSYPFYETWQKYKLLSPWRGMSDKMPDNRKWATWVKRYVLWPLGIMLKKPELIEA